MSAKALELDSIHLTSSLDKVRLSASTTVDVLLPEHLAREENQENIDTLESGIMWVVRGPFCSLDFFLAFDQMLDIGQRVHICESLGYQVRDAHLWSQLLMLPKLTITQQDGSAHLRPDFSLQLSHSNPPPDPKLQPKGWLAGNVDVTPPESVPCATIQGLQIRLKFQSIQKKLRPASAASKRIKVKRGQSQQEPLLLESSSDLIPGSDYEVLEGIVAHLSHSLSQSVARCFGFFEPDGTGLDPMLLDEPPIDLNSANIHNAPQEGHDLRDMLRLSSDLDVAQKNVDSADEEMLLLPDQPVDPNVHHEETNDGILLARVNNEGLSIVSQPFSSSDFSKQSSTSSLKRPASAGATTIPVSPAESGSSATIPETQKLFEAVVRTLLIGNTSKICRSLGNLTVSRPLQQTSLARLAPGVFSPGYREAIASNAHFLPTISLAVSSSWPRNVQSPNLKRKLVDLASHPTTGEASAEGANQDDNLIFRLSKTVQHRLWSMMQRKLYDHSATKLLLWKADEKGAEILDDVADHDLLRDTSTGEHDDYLSEFEDLLDGNDDDSETLNRDSKERERKQTEHDTDEMLFGCGWDVDQYDSDHDPILFLDHSHNDESMLII